MVAATAVPRPALRSVARLSETLVTLDTLEGYSMEMIMISEVHLQLLGYVSEQYTMMACL